MLRAGALAAALATLAAHAHAAERETTWMQVLLDGRKIGHLEHTRAVADGRVTTTERMEATLDRAGIAISMVTEETSIETADGLPLGFRALTEFSGAATRIEGELSSPARATVTTTGPAGAATRTIEWPKGAVLAEGVRLAERRRGLVEGARYELLAFQPSNLVAVPVKVRIGGREPVALGLQQAELTRVEQRIELPGAAIDTQAWVDAQHRVRKASLPLLGLALEMIACEEACAKAPNQSADILARTMVDAPVALPRDARTQPVTMQLALALAARDATLPDVAEQTATAAGATWSIRVAPGAATDRARPTDDELASNRWLEADAPEIRALAAKATAGAATPRDRMQQLEAFVRGYIADKSLAVGYASALETAKSKEGDCTEHALLLAALGRAVGIPTRVVNGLAYADRYAGRDEVFVPHAWVQAYVGSHWQSYDAALPGFDAGHVAFAVGNGDPAGFYASVNLLGNVRVQSIESAAAR